jgi:hypothetical protein
VQGKYKDTLCTYTRTAVMLLLCALLVKHYLHLSLSLSLSVSRCLHSLHPAIPLCLQSARIRTCVRISHTRPSPLDFTYRHNVVILCTLRTHGGCAQKDFIVHLIMHYGQRCSVVRFGFPRESDRHRVQKWARRGISRFNDHDFFVSAPG